MKIRNLKYCVKAIAMNNNKFENYEFEFKKETFNERVLSEEIGNDFKVSQIMKISYAPRFVTKISGQFNVIPQQNVFIVENGGGFCFIINADPEDENFGTYDRIKIFKGRSVYIPPYHMYGFFSSGKGLVMNRLISGLSDSAGFYSINFDDLQRRYEKFSDFNTENCNVEDFEEYNGFDIEVFKKMIEKTKEI